MIRFWNRNCIQCIVFCQSKEKCFGFCYFEFFFFNFKIKTHEMMIVLSVQFYHVYLYISSLFALESDGYFPWMCVCMCVKCECNRIHQTKASYRQSYEISIISLVFVIHIEIKTRHSHNLILFGIYHHSNRCNTKVHNP